MTHSSPNSFPACDVSSPAAVRTTWTAICWEMPEMWNRETRVWVDCETDRTLCTVSSSIVCRRRECWRQCTSLDGCWLAPYSLEWIRLAIAFPSSRLSCTTSRRSNSCHPIDSSRRMASLWRREWESHRPTWSSRPLVCEWHRPRWHRF